MRLLALSLLFISSTLMAQKTPIGLIVKYIDDVSYEMKLEALNEIESLKPLTREHVLDGFNVCLVEGVEGVSLMEYETIMHFIKEESATVDFVSILYKTNKGAIGGDLPELYLKPKNEKVMDLMPVVYHDWKSLKRHEEIDGIWVGELSKYSTIDNRTLQTGLMATGHFDFVSVNTLHTVLATIDDPYFEHQWALENEATELHFSGTLGADMHVPDAWDLTTGDPSITIAVLDSGTDTNHIDLVGNLLPGFDATGGGTLGYPNLTYPNDGHGTCTAGIIASVGDNGEGTIGVAYSCKVVPVRIFYYVEFGGDVIPFTSGAAGIDGINWAVNTAKADILSNSWGLRESDILLLGIDTAVSNMVITNGIENGREGKGTPMLFSSGNEGDDYSIWPAAYPKTISVGASTMCDELKTPTDCSPEGWWGSNYGEELDVTAPGVKVLATDMMGTLGYNGFVDNNYSMFNGTSAACPNAAGVMALILSADPSLSAFDARAVLSITADKTGGYAYDTSGDFGMKSEEMGYGRVNAAEAVFYASTYTELKEEENSLKAQINYAQGETYLMLDDNLSNVQVTVYSLLGNIVAQYEQGEVTGNALNLNKTINTSGMYLIHVEHEGEFLTLKALIKK